MNFYEVQNSDDENFLLTLPHEITHGYINNSFKGKFNRDDNNYCLYREAPSILIELFANDYYYKNNIIDNAEYVSNYNDLYLRYIYNEIDTISILYEIANSDIKKNKKDIKRYIDDKAKQNITYDFTISELVAFPLEYYLVYLHSALIALSIYDKYKDSPNEGMKIMFEFMKKINLTNEQTLIKEYDLNYRDAVDNYIKRNDILIKKRNNN